MSQRPATLAFLVQLAAGPTLAAMDDATAPWSGGDVVRVATITIPVQEFRSAAQDKFADDISFNPWHCLAEHRPLGSINLARKRVYEEASRLRHANGGLVAREPDGRTDF